MTLCTYHRKPRRGVAVVEMAFILGIFMLFLVGIIEYARFLFCLHVATSATTTAARYAVVHTGDNTTSAQVQAKCTDAMASQQSMVTNYTVDVFAAQNGTSPPQPIAGANWTDASFGFGICVRVTGTYKFAGSGLLNIGGNGAELTVPINVSSVMNSEAN